MLERGVSFRRLFSAIQQDDAVSIDLNDPHPSASSHPTLDQEDDSKTKKPNLSLLTYKYVSRVSHYCFRPLPWLLLCFLLVFGAVFSVVLRSTSFVCVSRFDANTRVGFFRLDGVESDFGALGVPWCRSKHGKTVEWTSKDLLKGLEEFVPIYDTRPIKNNENGMGFDHSFGLWFIARWLKPDLMIESGAFEGHSTWVLRQARPETPIMSFTPKHPLSFLRKGPAYFDGNCTYFTEQDYVDFRSVNWTTMLNVRGITDTSRVLVFFNDHQNELRRVKESLNAGFRHLVFEDNYDTGTGDHYSLRQICDQFYIRGGGHSCFRDSDEARIRSKSKGFWENAVDTDDLCGPNGEWWGVKGWMPDNFNKSNVRISHDDHFKHSRFLESILDVYWELPPVAGPSLTHQTCYDPARSTPPIVEDGHYHMFQRLGLSRLDKSTFNNYTQMVYVEISEQ